MSTNNKTSTHSLFAEFPPVSSEEWEELIKKDLNGADYRQKLRWDTGEGIDPLPFYRREDLDALKHTGPVPAFKKKKNGWKICQPVFDQDVSEARKTALAAIKNGAEALQFKLRIHKTDGAPGGDVEGTAIQNQGDFKILLTGLQPSSILFHFDTSMISPAIMAMFHNEINERGLDPAQINATFLYDPYSFTITSGQYPKPEERFLEEARQMVEFCEDRFPNARCLGVDARTYHNAGAAIVQELAFALATGNEYLAKLTDLDLSVDEIASRLHFSFSVGSDYFLEIAKFRAFRWLWANVAEAYDPETYDAVIAYIHGETSAWNKTVYDPYTNILRTTTEGMSAAIAGCDAITVHPFNLTYRKPDEFAQRIARNSQIIFKEEAWLDQVHDPGAGSYYIETLTDQIAGEAWDQFREIEKQGGMLKAVTNQTVAAMVKESARKRDQAIAGRGRVFVGANKYPNADDRMLGQLNPGFSAAFLLEARKKVKIDPELIIESLAEAFKNGAQLGDVVPSLVDFGKQLFRPVQSYRGPEAFEELRLETEKHPSTPAVFLLPAGNRKLSKARSTFASGFFGCAGYQIKEPAGFETIEEAMNEIKKVQPEIVVICSSDEEYAELVEPACKQLKSLDQEPIIVLAGYPENETGPYKKAGVDVFIHEKTNVLETLKEFHQKLGIIERG